MANISDPDINTRWRAIAKQFPAWMLPFDVFFNPSTYRFIGANLIPSMTSDGRVRRAAKILHGASPDMLEALAGLARLNEARTGEAFKTVAVSYVTVPIALAALVSEAAPDFTRMAISANLDTVAPIVIAFVLTPIAYFCGHWRAKQIAWTIELFRTGALATAAAKP